MTGRDYVLSVSILVVSGAVLAGIWQDWLLPLVAALVLFLRLRSSLLPWRGMRTAPRRNAGPQVHGGGVTGAPPFAAGPLCAGRSTGWGLPRRPGQQGLLPLM